MHKANNGLLQNVNRLDRKESVKVSTRPVL